MRYLIFTEDIICEKLSLLVIEEIKRLDLRSEIKLIASKELKNSLKSYNPSLLIIIGSLKSYSAFRRAKKTGVKICFFYQSWNDPGKNLIGPVGDLFYPDLPMCSGSSNTLLVADFIRKQEKLGEDKASIIHVSIFHSEDRNSQTATSLKKKLEKRFTNIHFSKVNCSFDFHAAIQSAYCSNAMISLDRLSNLIAAYTNCPTVNVYRNSLFKKANNRVSPLNKLVNNEVVKDISENNIELITEEINRILNDHQYCAGIMQSYQEIKNVVGTHPFARQAVREIIDWMEEED